MCRALDKLLGSESRTIKQADQRGLMLVERLFRCSTLRYTFSDCNRSEKFTNSANKKNRRSKWREYFDKIPGKKNLKISTKQENKFGKTSQILE
jgi:hypothetical protein